MPRGTYLNARCIHGEYETKTRSQWHAVGSRRINAVYTGFRHTPCAGFKTGTPARVDGKTIDFDRMQRQDGDAQVIPFSFETDPKAIEREQLPCYLTYTNEKTHEIIRQNLHRSPFIWRRDSRGWSPVLSFN